MIAVPLTSLILQILAVGVAIQLTRKNKIGIGPLLIILALILMLARRAFVYFALGDLIGRGGDEFYKEWNALFTTILTVFGLLLIGKVLSKNKKVDAEDNLNRERLTAIILSSEDAIITKNLQGIILSWNPSAERIFGYTTAEAIGQPITMLIPPERLYEEKEILSKIAAGIRVEHLETERVKKNGERIFISVTSSPIKGADGEIIGATKIARDITLRKKQDQRLLESEAKFKALAEQRSKLLEQESGARKQVETANRIKDQFLATLSHELRTPLNAILGWSQILTRDSSDPKRVADGLRIIERNARSQSQIIEDLLDVNRIISGTIHLDIQELEFVKMIEEAVDSIRPAASAKEISIVKPQGTVPVFVKADQNRLRQIIWNLLTNAVKFTGKSGVITISLAVQDEQIELRVEDNGEGIDSKFLPHIFDRFSQADSSKTRKHGGLGLGLSIVRDLCQLQGGSISVSSEGIGKGSRFLVLLPKAKAKILKSTEIDRFLLGTPNGESLIGLAILVVDDEEDARGLVREFLEEKLAKVMVASSSADALSKLAANSVDLIISDISMPDEDGYSLIRKVRNLSDLKKSKIPAIALTAFAKSEDRDTAISSGFQSYVTKPLELSELLTEINAVKKAPLG